MATDPRQCAFETLLRFEKGGASRLKADSLMADALAGAGQNWAEADRRFFHALTMGTLRHWLRLGIWMETLTKRKLKQIDPPVRTLLRMGLFQLYGLNQVPAYAAINTTVELAKTRQCSDKTIKFINAVLREAQRRLEADGFSTPDSAGFAERLQWEFGWPAGLISLLQQHYDNDAIEAMAQAAQNPAAMTIRVNTLKIAPEAYLQQLAEAGIPAETISEIPEGLLLPEFSGSPRLLPGYEAGLFYVQDPASMWVSHLLSPKSQENVLDLCAAPGSKTTHLAALMSNANHQKSGNIGNITAIEPKAERIKLLQENLTRLGVTNVTCLQTDGLQFEPDAELFDKVLVDAPCSGSGTLRRHPEILLHLQKPNLTAYTQQQTTLLEKGFACLKPGGVLVYSTCSILKAENQDVVDQFLTKHKNATLDFSEQRGITQNADGFYAARILKK